MGDDQHYDAFVSYNQRVDHQLAGTLRSALQQFAKPWHVRRALRVFLDKESLEATSALSATLESKLLGARYLILLAGRASVASPWCEHEVRCWLEHHRQDNLVIVLTDPHAALVWDRERATFDPGRTTALPPSLVGAYVDEPLWLDMSWYSAEDIPNDANERDPRFLDAVATLSATVREVPKDELIGEDLHQHSRLRRARRIAVTSLAMLTTLAIAASIVVFVLWGVAKAREAEAVEQREIALDKEAEAVEQRGRAEVNEADAITQRGIADARRLAAQSASLVGSETDTAALLAVESLGISETVEGLDALALVSTTSVRVSDVRYDTGEVPLSEDDGPLGNWIDPSDNPVPTFDTDDPPVGVAMSDAHDMIASAWQAGRLTVVDGNGDVQLEITDVNLGGGSTWGVDVSGDGRIVGVVGGTASNGWARFWNLSTGDQLPVFVDDEEELHGIAIDHGGLEAFVGGSRGVIRRFDLRSADETDGWSDPTTCQTSGCTFSNWIWDLDLDTDGRLAAGTGSGTSMFDTTIKDLVASPLPGELASRAVQFAPDGSLNTWYLGGAAKRFDFIPVPEPTPFHEQMTFAIDSSADGHIVATGAFDGTVVVTDDQNPGRKEFPRDTDLSTGDKQLLLTQLVLAVAVDSDGEHVAVATGTFDGTTSSVAVWNIDTGATRLLRGTNASDVDFVGDGSVVIGVAPGGIPALVEVASLRYVAQPGRIDLWWPSEQFSSTLTDVDGLVLAVDASPDGRRVGAATTKGSVHVVDISSPPGNLAASPVAGWNWALGVEFSEDGRTIAASGDSGMVIVESVDDPTDRRTLLGHDDWVRSLAFLDDDATLATAGYSDGTLRLWDVERGVALGVSRAVGGGASGVARGPDGQLIVSTGDGSLSIRQRQPVVDFGKSGRRVEFSGPRSWASELCTIAGRNLTAAEWSTYIGSDEQHATCPEFDLVPG